MSKFKAKYSVSDGYAGPSRPQYFSIDANDIEEDMDENQLQELFNQEMQNSFENKIYPEPSNIDEFVEWAKEILESRDKS